MEKPIFPPNGTDLDKKPAQHQASALLCDPRASADYPTDGGNPVDLGAHPGNTAPPNCINPIIPSESDEHETSVLRTGVDSLYLSFFGELFPAIEANLEKYKELAKSTEPRTQSEAVIHLADHCFEVKASGKGRFAFVLVNNIFHIQVSRQSAQQIPMAYVQISSEALTRTGIKYTTIALTNIISVLGKITLAPSISRVDICADFVTSFNLASIRRDAWVSRSNKFHNYYEGKILTGFMFGQGSAISARLYNKTVEIKKSKKTWLFPIWQESGWDGLQVVWRLEYQYRRDVLRQFRIQTVTDLISRLPDLWAYSTLDWLKLTLPSLTDTTQSRWPLHPLWLALSVADWGTDRSEPLTRIRKERLPHDDYLFINGLSAITSIMARDGLADFDEAFDIYISEARAYHLQRSRTTGQSLRQYALDKAFQKARRYNTIKEKSKKGEQ